MGGENKRLTSNEVYEIIQKQQGLIELCKREIEDRTIYFNDQAGDKIELTQGIFDFLVSKMNSNDVDSVENSGDSEKDGNNDENADENKSNASESGESCESSESSEKSNLSIDAHGNKSSNISFDVVSCS